MSNTSVKKRAGVTLDGIMGEVKFLKSRPCHSLRLRKTTRKTTEPWLHFLRVMLFNQSSNDVNSR